MTAKIPLYSFFSYMKDKGGLFKELTLPAEISKDDVIDNILLKGGDFCVLYQDPEFMQYAIGTWCRKYQPTFIKWVKALNIEYNPLENYDRFEDTSTTSSGTTTGNVNGTHSDNLDVNNIDHTSNDSTQDVNRSEVMKDDGTNTTTVKDNITEHQVSAFNDVNYSPSSKDINNSKQTLEVDTEKDTDITEKTSNSNTIDYTSERHSKGASADTTSEHRSDERSDATKSRIHGNIGVTTSQAMLEAELKIDTWSIIEHITDLFLKEFIIPIY